MEVVIAFIAFLLIVQSVGENTGMKEDPHIEEGKTIDVNKKMFQCMFPSLRTSYSLIFTEKSL